MNTRSITFIAILLCVFIPAKADQVNALRLNAVSIVTIRRIPKEVYFPVATSLDSFPKRVVFEVNCVKPYNSGLIKELVALYNARGSWVLTSLSLQDVRWSISMKMSGNDVPIIMYFDEKSDVFWCDGNTYEGGEAIIGLLNKYLAGLK